MSRDGLRQKHEAKTELKTHQKKNSKWGSIIAASLSQVAAVVREEVEGNCVTQEY